MVLVKILGAVDLLSSLAFLMLVFDMSPWLRFTLFCAGMLLLKGLISVAGGEIPLSIIDIFSSVVLILSIFFTVYSILLWIPAFLLLAKGFVSFL